MLELLHGKVDSRDVKANNDSATLTIETVREGRVWAWLVNLNGETLAGGYCRTKADALDDARIWIASRTR